MFESNWKGEWGATMSVLGDDEAPLPAIPDRLIVPLLSATQQRLWKRMDKQAIDATEAYVGYVSEIMEGLPSEFTECLDAAARERREAAGGEACWGLEERQLGSRVALVRFFWLRA